jgi:hypothetical protein
MEGVGPMAENDEVTENGAAPEETAKVDKFTRRLDHTIPEVF